MPVLVLPKAGFDQLVWSDIIGGHSKGGGRTQQGISSMAVFHNTSGSWNHSSQTRGYGLKKAVFRIPALPKAEFDRLVWSDIIGDRQYIFLQRKYTGLV